ncbi:hypothetical protein [Kitasatospora cineracea]|uniref:Uncharacterized protein n=1 Tax=Kitasatospora cineracea TaxID=88074 RepID=A0A3N4S6D1_9ACTN|nr:hypothetical protein [Kitasatospora cineracea]RPE36117.1 hypothetical protein EDD38_4484 [Kitasatospora cineracea]
MTDQDTELRALLHAFGELLPPDGSSGGGHGQESYELVESTRLHLGSALAAAPEATARLAGQVFRLLAAEHPRTSRLTDPPIGAPGHRAFLEGIISLLQEGSWEQRANAAAAAHRIPSYHDRTPVGALRAEYPAGRVPGEQLRERYARALRDGSRPAVPYADLWPRFWPAAAECFTACSDREVRGRLALAFPLEHPGHLPRAAPVLAAARRIAERETGLHPRLLAGSTGYGTRT